MHCVINVAASGDNVLIPGTEDRRIVILAYMLQYASDVNTTFKSNDTSITGPLPKSHEASYNEHGHFRTEKGEALVISLDGAVQVGGYLTYKVE